MGTFDVIIIIKTLMIKTRQMQKEKIIYLFYYYRLNWLNIVILSFVVHSLVTVNKRERENWSHYRQSHCGIV